MIGLLIAILAVLAVIVLAVFYILLLSALYPERLRTNEVYYLRTRDLWLLRVCRYRKGHTAGEPVLLVHGMGANQNNFAFPPGGCLVDYLSAKGYDCWTLDLRGCRSSEPPFERTRHEVRMEDFFLEDLPAVIQHILKTTNYPKVHWVGHSMGGMLLYAFVRAHGDKLIASGTTLGSPIDFNDTCDNIPAWLVGLAGTFPRLSGNIIRGIIPVLKTLGIAQSAFPVNMNNLPAGMNSGQFINMIEDPLPGLMSQVKHWIKNREYTLDGGRLDIAEGFPDFSVPLLAVYAADDPFINAPRALSFFQKIKTKDKRAFVCSKEKGYVEDYGHCDLAFGKAAPTEIFEPILDWLLAHPCHVAESEERTAKSAPAPRTRAKAAAGTEAALVQTVEKVSRSAADAAGAKKTVKPKAAPKSAPAKKPAAKAKPAAVKKNAATVAVAEKAPVKKKPAAPKKAAVPKKNASAPKRTAAPRFPQSAPEKAPIMDGMEISPEALARAEAIRAARNQTFSEIDALLSDTPRRG